ncbi:acyl carrier protein [Phaeovulum sp. NW3]|uniref:acyl carrier protein n=1 Tax=Phaeovulum sp. NW3 TaxID=2934933 RepID=UPI002020557B|nr:acyl carrier protein [Phaeovulum sp. NW3]MCL7463960.1 acyl carrier protein [Phaeovulum sp. NW3]
MSLTVSEQIIAILAREAVLDPHEVRPEMTIEDLGLDSLGLVETIFAIEETFDISVPFNANDPAQGDFDISSVGAIVAAVERLIAARGAALA